MKRISLLGVLIGGIVDVVATNILALPIILYILLTNVNLLGLTQEEMTKALTQILQSNWMLFTMQLVVGSFCSILGGYIAAYIAKHDELVNGTLSAYLCVGIGVYSAIKGLGTESIVLTILGFILSPALGLFGGYLRVLQLRSRQPRKELIATT